MRVIAIAAVALVALVAALVPATASATPEAQVVAVTSGGGTIDVVLAVPKGIDNAARNGNADFAVQVSVTYISNNGTVETLNGAPVPLKDTTFLAAINEHTNAVGLSLQLGGLPPPGNNPSFSATVQLIHPG